MRNTTARELDTRDLASCALVLLLLALHVLRSFNFDLTPTEDASILLRYADHLSRGFGIVWNIGEGPVDGATDFFLMVTLAAFARLGMGVENATFLLGFASHVLTILLVYAGARRLHGAPRWMASLSAAFLALGPGVRYIEVYFGTPYFALFAVLCWYLATSAFLYGETTKKALLFGVCALLMGMTRPEGVFLSGFMLAALVVTRGLGAGRKMLIYFAAILGVFGSAYFAWRWTHFGYPLPNTYYVRGGGGIYWHNLEKYARNLLVLALPMAPIIACALVGQLIVARRLSRRQVFFLLPVACFTALGVLHLGLMDYLYRFQYCLLPIVLLSWPGLLMELIDLWKGAEESRLRVHQELLAASFIVLFFAGALAYQVKTFPTSGQRWWGTKNVAEILAEYSSGYTVAVTNAGHIPYLSGWKALDAWGLNDQEIAHGGLTDEIIERYRPEVIQFDDRFIPVTGEVENWHPWAGNTKRLRDYAVRNDYVLAAAFGVSPSKTHYYYVQRDFPDSEAIINRIRSVRYHIGGWPDVCFDFSAKGRASSMD